LKRFSPEDGFAPAPLTPLERARLGADLPVPPDPVRLDYPDFLDPALRDSLRADFEPVLAAMQARAPVDLRVNALKTNPNAAIRRARP
jgi:16S rRNA (cytosine967-C5)-methyltransferase